jgi:hypothetical protein
MKFLKKLLALPVCALVFFSCATSSDAYKKIDAAVGDESYDRALQEIADGQESKKPIYPDKNLILYYLDRGIVEHYAGKYGESAAALEEAERLIEEAYTKSVSAEIGSYIANDNVKDYAGEDYEDIYTNVFAALNYYHTGNIEGAGVEIRQMTEKFVKLEDKYAGDGNKARQALEGDQSISLPSGKAVGVSDSVLGRYLSAVIYRSLGQPDSARIDIEAIDAAHAKAPGVYSKNSAPAWLRDELTVPEGQARLNILAFAGLSPVKEEEVVFLPSFFQYAIYTPVYIKSLEKKGNVLSTENSAESIILHLPRLVPRPSVIDRIEADISGTKLSLDLLEDMGAVMSETFNAKLTSTMIKTFVRTAVKGLALEAAARIAQEKGQPEMAIRLAAAGGMVAFDKTESADTRSSRYFPGKAYAGGITLNPGVYDITIHYYSGSRVVYSVEKPGVQVAAGKLNLIETASPK